MVLLADLAPSRKILSISRDDLTVPARTGAPALSAENGAALASARSEDAASSLGSHTGAEPVGLAPLAIVGLVRALHDSSDHFPRYEGKARRLYWRS